MVRIKRTWVGLLMLGGLVAERSEAAPGSCLTVRQRVDRVVANAAEPVVWRKLAPYVGRSGLEALWAKTATSSVQTGFEAYLALGFSRKADALRLLRMPPDHRLNHEGRSLALLALGDPVESGTVAWALTKAPLAVRRRTSHALADMRHHRPRSLLAMVIDDPDPEIRMDASLVYLPYRSRRARRNLLALVEGSEPRLKARAAHELLHNHHRFRPADLRQLPDEVRGRAFVQLALSHRHPARWLRAYMSRRDPRLRAGAIAVWAILEPDREALGKAIRRGVADDPRFQAERAMAWVLAGHTDGLEGLSELSKPERVIAIEILWAFSGARMPHRTLDQETARGLARVLERWLVQGGLSKASERRLILALEASEADAGLQVARARLLGPPGPGLKAALAVVARRGHLPDVPALMSVAARTSAAVQSDALVAASLACARAP